MPHSHASILHCAATVGLLLSLSAGLAQPGDVPWDLESAIESSAGDSEEFLEASSSDPRRWPQGFSYPTSSDLELGRDTSHAPQVVGLRFTGLAIPADARIAEAAVVFTADSDGGGPLQIAVSAQASAEPPAFSLDPEGQGSFDLSGRAVVGQQVGWPGEPWTGGREYRTPDLAALLQEVVDDPSWRPGGAVVFLFAPSSGEGTRSAYAFDASARRAPRLLVRFEPVTAEGEAAGAEPEAAEAEGDAAAAEPEAAEQQGEPADAQRETEEAEGEAAGRAADQAAGQAAGQAEQPSAQEPAPDRPLLTEPRRARFRLEPNHGRGVRGSVLLSDYGRGITMVTVFLDNAQPAVSYPAAIRTGRCGSLGSLVAQLEPVSGSRGFSTTRVGLDFDEFTAGDHQVVVTRTSDGLIRISGCAVLNE